MSLLPNMKKLLFSFLAIAYVSNSWFTSAVAREKPYGGKCLYINQEKQEQEFKSCQVSIQQKNIAINFEKEKYQDNNKTITGKSVFEIASGEYAKKLLSDTGSIVGGILLGPITFVGRIFAPDRDYQQYVVEYTNTQGKKTATVLNINRSDAPEFQQEITIITGKFITFQPKQTETTINVGPDLDEIK